MRVLYVDFPFSFNYKTGAASRSRFLYRALTSKNDVDVLLINSYRNEREEDIYCDAKSLYHLDSEVRKSLLNPEGYLFYGADELRKFDSLIATKKYDIVFFRFYFNDELASRVKSLLPEAKVVIDVDLLFSDLTKKFFKINPTLSNRYYLKESIKLTHYEKKIFAQNYTFLFANNQEMKSVANKNGHLVSNPMMSDRNCLDKDDERKDILFYGALNSEVMRHAFKRFVKEGYRYLKEFLIEKNLYIDIVGRGDRGYYDKLIEEYDCSMIRFIGEVEDIDSCIRSKQLVILPIHIFSGTLTRIFEVIMNETPVVATENITESIRLENYIPASNDFKIFAKLVIQSLNKIEEARKLASVCRRVALKKYHKDIVSMDLLNILETQNLREVA